MLPEGRSGDRKKKKSRTLLPLGCVWIKYLVREREKEKEMEMEMEKSEDPTV